MIENMASLQQITDAQFQVSQAKMQTITTEEQRIRKTLLDLELQRQTSGSDGDMVAIRALGADIMWQVWVDRKRAALHIKLAQILVRKANAANELRHTFGKNQACIELQLRQQTRRKQKQTAARLAQEQARLIS